VGRAVSQSKELPSKILIDAALSRLAGMAPEIRLLLKSMDELRKGLGINDTRVPSSLLSDRSSCSHRFERNEGGMLFDRRLWDRYSWTREGDARGGIVLWMPFAAKCRFVRCGIVNRHGSKTPATGNSSEKALESEEPGKNRN